MVDETHSFEANVPSGRKKGVWKVTLEGEKLTLRSADGNERHEMSKDEAKEKIEFPGVFFGGGIFVAQVPKRQAFHVGRENVGVLKEWLGPATSKELRAALKRRLKWCLPIGVFLILSSLPLGGNPEAGVAAKPFDLVSFALGMVLIGVSIAMRLWPRAELFLVDSAWFTVLAIKVVYDITQGGSWLWGLLAVMLVFSVIGGVGQYLRFASVDEAVVEEEAAGVLRVERPGDDGGG